TEVFENRRVFRRDGGKVVEGLVDPGGEAGCRDVVSQYSAIDHLGEKRGPWNQFAQKVRDVLLPFRHECLVVSRSSAERDHNRLLGSRQGSHLPGRKPEQTRAGTGSGRYSQEFTPAL